MRVLSVKIEPVQAFSHCTPPNFGPSLSRWAIGSVSDDVVAGLNPMCADVHARSKDGEFGAGLVLLKCDQRLAILLSQMKVADKTVVDDLLDHRVCGVERRRACLDGKRLDRDCLGAQCDRDGATEIARCGKAQ